MKDNLELIDNDLRELKIIHPRRVAIKCWDKLLLGCSTLSCFISRLEKYAKKIENNETVDFFDKYKKDGANSFKGDVTEIFAEYVLKGYGRTWGIYNYTPFFISGEEQDVGVDGTGKTKEGMTVTVQIKYGNWEEELDYVRRKLRTFHWTSIFKYGVGITSTDQMFIFTLANTINWKALGGNFHGRLKFISQEESGGILYGPNNDPVEIFSLKSLCNNNSTFWNTFYRMVKE
jgi:hypothetical protein